MTCGQCKHYEPTRNPDTGRVLPSQAGRCAYPVMWPELPLSFTHNWHRPRVQYPVPTPVSPGSCDGCKMFEPKKTMQKTWQESERLI